MKFIQYDPNGHCHAHGYKVIKVIKVKNRKTCTYPGRIHNKAADLSNIKNENQKI